MKQVISERLFNYCQKHLRDIDSGKFKITASLKQLANDYGVGRLEDGYFYFDNKDKQHLIEMVAIELNGVHLFRENYPNLKTRNETAKYNRAEKVGALNVAEDFILVNSLGSLHLNQQVIKLSTISSLGQFLCASQIQSIEHKKIVLVENLIVMANLARLNLPAELKEALWLYRGDIQAQQQTSSAYQFFRRFKATHQLICFSDIDPSGLQIALTSGATQLLTLANTSDLDIALKGHEIEWFKQQSAINYLNNYHCLPEHCSSIFLKMKQIQKTLKQEHIIAHSLPLTLHSLVY